MSLNAVLLAISGLNGLVGLYVLRKNPKKAPNQAFACLAAAVALWTLGVFFAHNDLSSYDTLARLAFASGVLMPVALLALFKVLPEGSEFRWQWDLTLFALAGGIFAILFFTPLIIIERFVFLTSRGIDIQFTRGPLYRYFVAYVLACLAYAFWGLIGQYRRSSGLMRLQLRCLILGLVVPGILVTTTNLLIPSLFGTSRFGKYGPLFTLFMIVMIGHAIIRHRLMDIRVVVKKGLVYIAAFVVAGALLTGMIVGSNLLLPNERPGVGREILLGLFVALLFHPLKGGIQRGFDRYLYRGFYNYQQTIREASRRMATILDLDYLLPYLCEVIGRTTRPEMIGIYIRNTVGQDYLPAATRWFIGAPHVRDQVSIPEDSALPQLLWAKRTPVLRDDLGNRDSSPLTRTALSDLTRLGGELALPIWDEDRLKGLLVVGPKLSGDPFFSEDLDLLSTLTSQAAIALKNAQLYHEVVLVNEYLENILKTMESGVVAVNMERNVTLFNPTAERMTGLRAADIRSGPVSRLPAAVSASIEATLADGQPRLQVEMTLSELTGRATPVVCSTSPFRDARGKILGAVLVFSDLTHLKELEGEKRRAERLAAFEATATGIAHEIKNPLVAIRTFAQLLPKKFADEEFRENFSKVAVQEIERITDLVDRLRGIAKSSSQPLAPLDLRGPIEEILALLQGQLEQARITVNRVYDAELPSVAGDPAQLKQLFLNLFTNALEAMEPGGELSIRLSSREMPGRHILGVEISDTGPGISDALLGKVFDPFVTTKPRGSGLGLSICRGIADAHRATIYAQNRPDGRGTTIVTEFPAIAGPRVEPRT